MIFLFVATITLRLSSFFFNYIARIFVKPLYNLSENNFPYNNSSTTLLVSEKSKNIYLILLTALSPNIHFYIFRKYKKFSDLFLNSFSSVSFIYENDLNEKTWEIIFDKIKIKETEISCLVIPNLEFVKTQSPNIFTLKRKKIDMFDIYFTHIQTVSRKQQTEKLFFKKTKVNFSFTKKKLP